MGVTYLTYLWIDGNPRAFVYRDAQRLEAVDEVVHRADVSSTMMQEKVWLACRRRCMAHAPQRLFCAPTLT